MFKSSKAVINKLEHKVAVLESNLGATERRLEAMRRDRDALQRRLDNPFRTEPHQHDFAELERRILAHMAAGNLPDDWVYRGYSRSQWRSGYASLQNLPRRTPPKLTGLNMECLGRKYQWAVGEKGIIGLKVQPAYKDPSKLKVFVYFDNGAFSTTTFERADLTQPTTYLWENQ